MLHLQGMTALHWACSKGHLDAVKLLIEFHAFPNHMEHSEDRFALPVTFVVTHFQLKTLLSELLLFFCQVHSTRLRVDGRTHGGCTIYGRAWWPVDHWHPRYRCFENTSLYTFNSVLSLL